MEQITLSAYAKINLTLSITGKREDGYHTLQTVMQEISLADTLTLSKIPSGIVICCDRDGIPTDEKNLCYKAAKRYLDAANIAGGVHITLRKSIPDGAGMGGGSSDAAAVLKGLYALYPATVPLSEIALSVGADVPFFLSGKTAFCEGIGEEVTPLSFPSKGAVFCVAAKNCPGLSTPKIYALFDAMTQESKEASPFDSIQNAFASKTPNSIFSLLQNDLELPAISLRPEIAQLKASLLSLGADAAMMTGSGSAVFGLFQDEQKARAAAQELKKTCTDAHFCVLL